MYQDETATKIIKRQSILESNRSTWDNHWFEIDELVAPSPNYFHGNNPTPGRKNNDKIFDVTATGALNRFIAAMSSTLTPVFNAGILYLIHSLKTIIMHNYT